MTRINIAVKPKQLTDQHLIAEHHEIIRIPGLFKARLPLKRFQDLPKKFTLGNGHVLFFLTKGVFTLKRYKELNEECLKRSFNVTDYSHLWDVYKNTSYFFDYEPNFSDRKIIVDRISQNLMTSKQLPLYYSNSITRSEAITLLAIE